jgi:hypothetical protein
MDLGAAPAVARRDELDPTERSRNRTEARVLESLWRGSEPRSARVVPGVVVWVGVIAAVARSVMTKRGIVDRRG